MKLAFLAVIFGLIAIGSCEVSAQPMVTDVEEMKLHPVLESFESNSAEEQYRESSNCYQEFASSESRFVGTNYCVQCHKDGHRFPTHQVAGKEYSIWVNQDPHSCSYNTLFKEESLQIAKNLRLREPPHQAEICLNCHITNPTSDELVEGNQWTPADGIGCESCHGAAERWLVAHKLPSWQSMSPTEKSSLGFVNTDNLAERTRKCVECHVGSEGKDVNHDLIAAGHPRLYFEMSTYQAKMPRHWSREKDLYLNSSETEARLWMVGQFVSSEAAIDLLRIRASDDEKPWPELAEYGCFSCHHDLKQQRWKGQKEFFMSRPGVARWGTWHIGTTEQIVLERAETMINGPVSDLRNAMQAKIPDRERVVQLCQVLKPELVRIADSMCERPASDGHAIEIVRALMRKPYLESQSNWDMLTQKYLAAVATRQAIVDSRYLASFANFDPDFARSRLIELRNIIKFVEPLDGPYHLSEENLKSLNQKFLEIFQF